MFEVFKMLKGAFGVIVFRCPRCFECRECVSGIQSVLVFVMVMGFVGAIRGYWDVMRRWIMQQMN